MFLWSLRSTAKPGLAERSGCPSQIRTGYPAPTGEPVSTSRSIHLLEAVLLQNANETPSLPGDAVHRLVGLCQPSCVRPDNLLPLPTQRPKRASRCPPQLTRYRTRPGSIPVRCLARAALWSPTATATMDACTPHPSRFRMDTHSFEVGVGASARVLGGSIVGDRRQR